MFSKSKKFRVSEFSWVIRSSFRSSEVLMGFQKFRSSEVEKSRSSHGVSKVQMFRNSTNSTYSVLRSLEVQEFRSSTSSQLLGELNSSYLDVDLTNNDTVKNRASTHAVEKRFLKKFKAKRQKGFIIALLSESCPK